LRLIVIAKLKKHKLPSGDQILTETIQARGETLLSEIHKLINSVWNKEELPDHREESIIVQIYKRAIKSIVELSWDITVINLKQNFIKYPFPRLSPHAEQSYWESSIWVSTLLTRFSISVKY
jgi:hypothetical protein